VKRDARIVHSTTDGDLRKPRDPLVKQRGPTAIASPSAEKSPVGAARPVTTVSGVPIDDAGLGALAGTLKKRCGVGGSVKGGVIEIQSDHRDVVVEVRKAEGYTPVLAGG
jgi:translation initiation factor 1